MKNFTITTLLFISSLPLYSADYKIASGKLHKKGTAKISVLPDTNKYHVKLSYKLKEKDFVPVPKKFLNDEKVMEFPKEFRTVAGYKHLESVKSLEVNKAVIHFERRGDFGELKNAYFIEVRPTNKKSKINIVYHPSLPDAGWKQVTIKMISNIALLDGYKLVANLIK
jgi:hypothetical protein